MADAFSAIGSAIKVAEFCFRFKEVSSENRVFLTLIVRVRRDLEEALRERHAKASALRSIPEKRDWIDGAILDAQRQLNSIGRLVEDARVDEQRGKPVSFKHRVDWVLTNHQKFVTEERALATAHQSLLAALAVLQHLPKGAERISVMTSVVAPPAYEMADGDGQERVLGDDDDEDAPLRSPFTRRPGRALVDTKSASQVASLGDIKSLSTFSLPEVEPILEDSWTDSLLELSLDNREQERPKLSHTLSDNAIDSHNSSLTLERFHSNPGVQSTIPDSSTHPSISSIYSDSANWTPQGLFTDVHRSTKKASDPALTTTIEDDSTTEVLDRKLLQERRQRARSRFQYG